MSWATREFARSIWADAPADDDVLDQVLSDANEQLLPFAPALAEDDPVPGRYARAEVYHAKDLWAAGRIQTGNDVLGFTESGYAITVRPLSTQVKALLRPQAGVPRIG